MLRLSIRSRDDEGRPAQANGAVGTRVSRQSMVHPWLDTPRAACPPMVEFYCSSRVRLGDKKSLGSIINEITGISLRALRGTALSEFSVGERFEWARSRQTKRAEDKAYSLLGMFDIYMPLIYGEGAARAFKRLEREIINNTSRFTQHGESN